MDCSLPESSAPGILQERILEWVAMPSPGDLPNPRIEPMLPVSPGLADGFFTLESPGKPKYLYVHACMLNLLSHVWLFVTLWTIAHQSPLSLGFSRQEYWNALPCLPPGDLLDPGVEPAFLMPPALSGGLFTTSITWEAQIPLYCGLKIIVLVF